MKLLQGRNM